MRLFRVDCYACGGAHRTYSKNEIMLESDFLGSQADDYVKSGHVVEVTEEEAVKFGYKPTGGADKKSHTPIVLTEEQIQAKRKELTEAVEKAKATKKPAKIEAAEKALSDFEANLN